MTTFVFSAFLSVTGCADILLCTDQWPTRIGNAGDPFFRLSALFLLMRTDPAVNYIRQKEYDRDQQRRHQDKGDKGRHCKAGKTRVKDAGHKRRDTVGNLPEKGAETVDDRLEGV